LFGFGLVSKSLKQSALRVLQKEAPAREGTAELAEQLTGLKYRAKVVSLGPQARALLSSRPILNLLATIFWITFALTEHRSCLTFYTEGDHLGPHLDKAAAECDVTIIIYGTVTGPVHRSSQTGLALRVYGREPRKNYKARVTIPTHTGGIVIGRGSKFWHERPTLQRGE
jgi:hypothetical protein